MSPLAHPPVAKYTDEIIRLRVNACPKLASLGRINKALRELVNSETSVSTQIAEIIRQDPSLTARLLRMVNSVYYGLSSVSNIEEAIFFLGLRQIRELAMATPVIEEMGSFMTKDGDCEDYAIAKFMSLRQLGFDNGQMRVVVVDDLNLGVAHAILVVYLDGRAFVLDNQIASVVPAEIIRHYRPVYSINEDAWWLHRR